MRYRAAATGLLLLAGLLTVAPAAPAAAADTGFLTGTIRDLETGNPVPGACATVFDPRLIERGQFCANGSGVYTTGPLDLVPYRLRFTNPGYATQWSGGRTGVTQAVGVTPSAAGTTANARLTKHFGTIAGTIRVPEGTTEPLHEVLIWTAAGSPVTYTFIKADGTYSVPDLPSGAYKIELFSLSGALPDQWLPAEADISTAAVYTVTDGATVTADGQFAHRDFATPFDSISGTVLTASGVVPGATVHFVTTDFRFEFLTVTADAAGKYTAKIPSDNDYKVQVEGAGVPAQWVPSAQNYEDGTAYDDDPVFTGTPGSFRVVPGWSTIDGLITDPSGAPLAGATVQFWPNVPYRGPISALTGADGKYSRVGLPEADYTMWITHPAFGTQYYPQKTDAADAQPFTLHHDQPLHVNERFLARGRIEITLLDRFTGAPITNACLRIDQAGLNLPQVCNAANGVYAADLAPGAFSAALSAPNHLTTYRSTASTGTANVLIIRSGQTTRIQVKLTPSGSLTLPVRANADGTYARTCAYPVPVEFAVDYPDVNSNDGSGFCNVDSSGTTSQIVMPSVAAGPTQVFVRTFDDDLGAQWLGATGGTGDQRKAAQITVAAGGSVTGPEIRLDPAGSIKGVTVAQDTRAPLAAVIRPFALTPAIVTYCSSIDTVTGCSGASNGAFLIGGLGPYDWPILFEPVIAPYAMVWSGGATNRFDAALIRVRPGQTTKVDVALPKGTVLTLNRGAAAAPYYAAEAFDVRTGDVAGTTWYGAGSAIVLNPGKYVVAYDDYSTSGGRDCWYAPRGEHTGGASFITGQVNLGTIPRSIKLVPGDSCLTVSPTALRTQW